MEYIHYMFIFNAVIFSVLVFTLSTLIPTDVIVWVGGGLVTEYLPYVAPYVFICTFIYMLCMHGTIETTDIKAVAFATSFEYITHNVYVYFVWLPDSLARLD